MDPIALRQDGGYTRRIMNDAEDRSADQSGGPATFWATLRRIVVRWVLILTGLYFLFAILLYFFQSGLIFHPTRELVMTPGEAGMAFEDVALASADGAKLHAWWVPAAKESRGTVIFCHGNAGNISHRIDSIRIFRNLGLDTLIFDYRGYGKSAGSPSEAGIYADAEAAWKHVTETRKIGAERVLIFGRSLGGAVAAHLAANHKPRAVILESAFSSVPDMGRELYPWLPRWLARYDFATAEYVTRVTSPLLSIHSPEDEIVPYALGRRVFDAATCEKTFLELSGGHNEGFMTSGRTYTDGLAKFVGGHFAPGPIEPSPSPARGARHDCRVVHLFVPLCDNRHQGIVKVSAALGDGQAPRTNLYWGAMYGAKTFFSRSSHWKRVGDVAASKKKQVLERVVFRCDTGKPVYLVADAYDGANMKDAVADFLRAAAGQGTESITAGGLRLAAGGASDLVAFTGHNGLMDFRLASAPRRRGSAGPECAIVLACKSRDYFAAPLKAARCRALLTTTGFMAPEAYTLEAALRSWAAGESSEDTRIKAAAAYAKYQKCSRSGALRLFATCPEK